MSSKTSNKKVKELARELAKDLKSEADLSALSRELLTVPGVSEYSRNKCALSVRQWFIHG